MVLAFKDIVAIEKRKTVKMIPNAIEIRQGNNQKQLFTSLLSRDQAFRVMYNLWRKHRHCPAEKKEKDNDDHDAEFDVQRQQAVQLSPDKQVVGRTEDYGWVLLVLAIVLLVSDISIAYRITHISNYLTRL